MSHYFYKPDVDPFAERLETLRTRSPIRTLHDLQCICIQIIKRTTLDQEEKDFLMNNMVFEYIKLHAKTLKIPDVREILESYPNANFISDLLDIFILHQNCHGVVAWYKCKKQRPKLTKKELLNIASDEKSIITSNGIALIDTEEMEETINFLWPELK